MPWGSSASGWLFAAGMPDLQAVWATAICIVPIYPFQCMALFVSWPANHMHLTLTTKHRQALGNMSCAQTYCRNIVTTLSRESLLATHVFHSMTGVIGAARPLRARHSALASCQQGQLHGKHVFTEMTCSSRHWPPWHTLIETCTHLGCVSHTSSPCAAYTNTTL
jgi:hypothetical protein